MPTASSSPGILAERQVALIGRAGGLTKRDFAQLIRDHGGTPVDADPRAADLIVVGADELPVPDNLLDGELQQAAAEGRAEIITETELWQRLGLLEEASSRLYTPAMLAELLHVPVATVRRWQRRGLIVPVKEVHKLAYFDFQEVITARRLANLLAAGISATAIEKKLAALSRYVRGVERPLAQLSVILEGRQILLRQDEGLIEPSGQLRFDFEALEAAAPASPDTEWEGSSVSFTEYLAQQRPGDSPEDLLRAAAEFEDRGQLPLAIEMYRATLAMLGPRADLCFQMAELLYRIGDLSAARERYFMAIELDDRFVEARANLGCLLAETGETELAMAAFQGALALHADYADVHYHLARTLGDLNRNDESQHHWREFLRLAPTSPWAEEARAVLGESSAVDDAL